ncbi:MAG TPA: twin-arginine translocation signal domain-containing protein [Candidatus Limnocylindrales bacterium]|nr:twin-arginine translocation signal domain-containing protein [Candidatus Limnocylindrales bacterium]
MADAVAGGRPLPNVTRRTFLKGGAAGAGAVGLTALGFDLAQAAQISQQFKIAGAQEANSLCPYCAVGCSLVAFTQPNADGTRRIVQIEGNPDSPVNEGRLCPKGATAMQLATSARRVEQPLYRAPGSDHWQQISWDQMLDKLAQRVKDARDATFVAQDAAGNTVNRTEGIAFAGGAAFSSEEGYLATKVMRGLGLIHLEQQARV